MTKIHENTKHFITEIDEDKGIVHFTSSSKLNINTTRKMIYMYKRMEAILKKQSRKRRLFMVVDFNSIIFDLDFNKQIVPFLEKLTKNYLYPNGAVAYGNSMSRLTLKMTLKKIHDTEKRFFITKNEAFDYINSLINEMDIEIPTSKINASQHS